MAMNAYICRQMKKLIFHVLALCIIASLLMTTGGIIGKMMEGENWKLNFASVLSTAGAVVAAYYGLGAALGEMYKRFRHGIANEFIGFFLNRYSIFHKPVKEIKPAHLEKIRLALINGIKVYCEQKLYEDKVLQIKEIENIPFEGFDQLGKPVPKTGKLVDTVCDFHTSHFAGATSSFVIGDAGAGKSFALRQMALSFLNRTHSKKIIPILLPISSYQKDSGIYNWIIGMSAKLYLQGKYQDFVHALVHETPEDVEIVYLLDGLDEIESHLISVFFEEMNKVLSAEHVIIGTRKEVFYLFQEKGLLSLYQYYDLKPLGPEKVAEIIRDNVPEPKADALLAVPEIPQKFKTPLLLGVLAKVVNQKEDLTPLMRADSVLETVWDDYADLVHRDKSRINRTRFHFPLEKLLHYAAWQARRGEQFFSLDDIQPIILRDRISLWAYALLSRLLIGIVLSIGLGFTMSGPFDFLPAGLLGGLLLSISFMLPLHTWIGQTGVSGMRVGLKVTFASLLFFMFALLVFGLFFALSGIRRDMMGMLAPADWIIGLFFAILFTIFGAIRDLRYYIDNDIQLMQKRHVLLRLDALDFPMALIAGLVIGVFLGLICAGSTVFYTRAFPGNVFTVWVQDTANAWQMSRFALAFWVVFPVAGLAGLFIGLNNPRLYKFDTNRHADDNPERFELPNFSVWRTVKNSLGLSALALVLSAVIWGWFNMAIFKTGWEGGNKGIESGLALGIFIGIWWGWKDIFKIWTLRLVLFLKGEAPLSFSRLTDQLKTLGIIIANGARFNFLEPSLHKYLASEGYSKRQKSISVAWILPLLLIPVLGLLVLRIAYKQRFYWQKAEQGLQIQWPDQGINPIGPAKCVALQDGRLHIRTEGLVRAGRIMGHVNPLGSNAGFFGAPMSGSYNILPQFKHGALLYRLSERSEWRLVFDGQASQFMDTYPPYRVYEAMPAIRRNDTLEFLINDLEWQNNAQAFSIQLSFAAPNDTITPASQ